MRSTIFLALVLLAPGLWAQETNAVSSPRIPIKLRITSESEGTIKSYVLRELRGLHDIDVVTEGFRYELSIVHLSVTQGEVISVVVLEPKQFGYRGGADAVMWSWALDLPEDQAVEFWKYMEYYRVAMENSREEPKVLKHLVLFGGDLKGLSEKIVTDFDAEVLQKERENTRALEVGNAAARGKSEKIRSDWVERFRDPSLIQLLRKKGEDTITWKVHRYFN